MNDQVRSPKLIPVIHSHKLPCFKEPVMQFFPVLISLTECWACFPQESHRGCTLALPKEGHSMDKKHKGYLFLSAFISHGIDCDQVRQAFHQITSYSSDFSERFETVCVP